MGAKPDTVMKKTSTDLTTMDTALLPGRYFGADGATVLALQLHDAHGLTSQNLATKFARTQPFDRHAAIAA